MLQSGVSRISCLDPPLLTLSVIYVSFRSQISGIKTNTKTLAYPPYRHFVAINYATWDWSACTTNIISWASGTCIDLLGRNYIETLIIGFHGFPGGIGTRADQQAEIAMKSYE